MLALWRLIHVPIDLPPRGPFPVEDSFGLRIAIAMLVKSLEPGRYTKDHQQFETIRKLRAAYSIMYMSSSLGVGCLKTFGGETAKLTLTNLPTNSSWFERFSLGCLRRMGQDVRQDWAIPVEAIHALLEALDGEWLRAQAWMDQHRIAAVGAFIVLAFCGSFRSNEVFLTDLFGLDKYLRELSAENHVIVPLLGKYKGEMHNRYHLTPLAATTNSGIQVRLLISRLVDVWWNAGRIHGPAFGTRGCEILEASFIEEKIVDLLFEIRAKSPGILPPDVDFGEEFGGSRSFRRGATSTARVRKVPEDVINLTNRWRKFEHAKGRRPHLAMQDHYSDIKILIPELVAFSQAL